MYCPKCGTENPDDAEVCSSCSSELTKTPATAEAIIPKTSGLALASFILGLISVLFFPLGLIAIILGIVGIIVIEKSGGRLTGKVFAVLGIVVPVLVFFLIFVLMMALVPALSRAREQGKRAVCLNNIRQLTLAWIMYADDNDDMIVNGAAGLQRTGGRPWTDRDWAFDYDAGRLLPEYEQQQAITDGALWPYCQTVQVYRCPSGLPGHMRTYSIVDSMNGIGTEVTDEIEGVYIKERVDIRQPGRRIVFIDVGEATPGTYSVYYEQQKWWDQPPVRHGDGTNFSFADGHAEYWRWKGTETIKYGKAATSVHTPNAADHWAPQTREGMEDLQRIQVGCWGQLGYQR